MEVRWMDVYAAQTRNRISRGHREFTNRRRSGNVMLKMNVKKIIKMYFWKAITCYYSYVINGLLEGEEKTIIMNRRIYKLIKNDNEFFFIHYLKDQ